MHGPVKFDKSRAFLAKLKGGETLKLTPEDGQYAGAVFYPDLIAFLFGRGLTGQKMTVLNLRLVIPSNDPTRYKCPFLILRTQIAEEPVEVGLDKKEQSQAEHNRDPA